MEVELKEYVRANITYTEIRNIKTIRFLCYLERLHIHVQLAPMLVLYIYTYALKLARVSYTYIAYMYYVLILMFYIQLCTAMYSDAIWGWGKKGEIKLVLYVLSYCLHCYL